MTLAVFIIQQCKEAPATCTRFFSPRMQGRIGYNCRPYNWATLYIIIMVSSSLRPSFQGSRAVQSDTQLPADAHPRHLRRARREAVAARGRVLRHLGPRQAGTNCIRIGLPGKLILSKRSSGSPFLLKIVSENQFSGKTYFHTIASS